MRRFEYASVVGHTPAEFLERLNDAGARGWEAFAFSFQAERKNVLAHGSFGVEGPKTMAPPTWMAWMKREVIDDGRSRSATAAAT